MSWLRSSPLRQSLTRNNNNNNNNPPFFSSSANSHSSSTALRQRPIDTATDCDPRACYDSFCKHWQQAYDIIQRAQSNQKTPVQVGHDDVLGVVSHLDFMVTLLLVELHHCNKIALPGSDAPPPAPCLEYMLSENLLDKLYEWGCSTGRYANAVRLEQLKLYELLVSHSRHQLLCHEPFLRPLLKILASSLGEIYPPDLEKRLVILLNQLCVLLMQNVHLLDLFFFSAAQEQHKQSGSDLQRSGTSTNFIIFSLLIPYVHREGSLGHQARDALLLCMALSQKNSNIGTYIAQYSSMCPLLVTGLGGLYSRLPNSIEITAIDWHRITPDDVTEIPELMLFMNALEFCNAVVQVAHEMIKNQLLDFMYQGFIVPVLGPAVLQTNIESQISAMSYLDLILRSVTEPQLMRAFVKFLLDTEKFDGERILDTLIDRLSSNDANLSMVTMALFDTLLGLNCEDLMYELLLKYVLPGKHIPISHRHKINKVDPYANMTEYLLEMTPDVMKRARELTKHKQLGDTVTTSGGSGTGANSQPPLPSPVSTMSKTIGANWNYYGLHTGDSLYANFHAYLVDAHYRIQSCRNACSTWANTYKYQKWPSTRTARSTAQTQEMVRQFLSEFGTTPLALGKIHAANGETQLMVDDACGEKKQLDSLQSLGESSGYESFKWRPTDEETDPSEPSSSAAAALGSTVDVEADTSTSSGISGSGVRAAKKEPWRASSAASDLVLTDLDFSEDLFAQGTVSLGPFINAIWAKLQTFTSNTLYVNLHLTGLITHLAWFPLPLVHSLLLRPDIVITSDTPSFHQVLRILKQQIDAELPVSEDSLEIVDIARSHLIDREFRLLNARKLVDGSPLHQGTKSPVPHHRLGPQTTFANISSASPVQVTPSSQYDPFKRNDSKRKSISKSITSMFSRKPNASSGLSQIFAFFTGSTTSPLTGAGSTTLATQQPTPASSSQTRETSLTTTPSSSDRVGAGAVSSTAQIHATSPSLGSSSNGSPLNPVGSTSTLSTLSAGTSVSTLLGSLSGITTGGGNSEPASLDSLTSMGALASTSGTERTRDLALCAVLLDEWLKELAAVAQEQSVVMVNADVSYRHPQD